MIFVHNGDFVDVVPVSVIEKIRAEIEQIIPVELPCDKRTPENIRDMALDIIDRYAEQEPTDEWQNGYDMAWEEAKVFYEQEPCDDVVSRQAVKDLIKSGISTDTYEDIELVCKWVDEMPPVRPQEQKSGHWITTRTLKHDGEYYCDKCKCDAPNNEKWDYCPNCGCRMVEPTCDTCEYNTATFMPCNACDNKSLFEPQDSEEISERNMKMWEELFKAESEDK